MSPDRRRHRGPHPEDHRLFAAGRLPSLRVAVAELSWLLSRGYAVDSALKLVGDRHNLQSRQRTAVRRCSCRDQAVELRQRNQRDISALAGCNLQVDGFNLIVTLEAAMSGGVILKGRDGCCRDLSSVHGSYRSVAETDAALELAGAWLEKAGPEHVHWLLDRPVSNSGRLAQRIEEIASGRGWPWSTELVFDPDKTLAASDEMVVTADARILDSGVPWANVTAALIARMPDVWLIDLAINR